MYMYIHADKMTYLLIYVYGGQHLGRLIKTDYIVVNLKKIGPS